MTYPDTLIPHPPVTQARNFCRPDGKPVLRVNPGIPVSDALEQASILLNSLNRLAINDPTNKDDRNAVQCLLEMTGALVDASVAGLADSTRPESLKAL